MITISEESQRQANSITSVTDNLEEMTRITQRHAATAEDSASVVNHFKYLAENLKDAEQALSVLVHGRG